MIAITKERSLLNFGIKHKVEVTYRTYNITKCILLNGNKLSLYGILKSSII